MTPAADSAGSRGTAATIAFPALNYQRLIPLLLWPLALGTMFHRSVILAINGAYTNDFGPVYAAAKAYNEHRSVYVDNNYDSVDPHYLYPPSGTFLFWPLGTMPYEDARWWFIGITVAAVVASAFLINHLFGYKPSSWVVPTILLFMFMTESVDNTLIFTNVNGIVLLCELGALWGLLRGHTLFAGALLGLTFAVKPVLAPLLLIPLLNRQWKTFITAVGVPLLLLIASWPRAQDPVVYFKTVAPYLRETRNYFNSSIGGYGAYFGVNDALILLWKAAIVVLTVIAMVLLWRLYRHTDELLWITSTAGILLGASFLLSPLGQGYYSMLMFPLLMTVFRSGSLVRNWPTWLGIYCCFTFDTFFFGTDSRWEAFGRALDYSKVTWGWTLLVVAPTCILIYRYLDLRRAQGTWWPQVTVEPADSPATPPATPRPAAAATS